MWARRPMMPATGPVSALGRATVRGTEWGRSVRVPQQRSYSPMTRGGVASREVSSSVGYRVDEVSDQLQGLDVVHRSGTDRSYGDSGPDLRPAALSTALEVEAEDELAALDPGIAISPAGRSWDLPRGLHQALRRQNRSVVWCSTAARIKRGESPSPGAPSTYREPSGSTEDRGDVGARQTPCGSVAIGFDEDKDEASWYMGCRIELVLGRPDRSTSTPINRICLREPGR